MKVALIQISDIHLATKRDYDRINISDRFNFFDDAVFNDVTNFVLILSGDLAASGEYANYNYIGKMIKEIKNKVKQKCNKDIKVIAVPGNHDLTFKPEELEQQKDIDFNPNYENDLVKEENRFKNYKNFCNSYSIPCVNFVRNYELKLSDELNIEFVLINSSYFSRFKHIDYGKHYIPYDQIHTISRPTSCDIKIGVIHHTMQWFEQSTKIALNNLIKDNLQVLFVGHEHVFEIQQTISNGENFDVLTVNGGAFYDKNDMNSVFNICILDSSSGLFSVNKASWNNAKKIYEFKNVDSKILSLSKGNKKFIIKNDKNNELNYLAKDRNVETFYMFPDMKYQVKENDEYKDFEIHQLQEFIEKIQDKKVVEIIGKNHNGKTALAKYLFLYYHRHTKLTPIVLDAIECQGKYDNWEKETFESYYEENKYDDFLRLKSNEKILIIDNFHLLKKDSKLISLIKVWMDKYFKIIIIQDKNTPGKLSDDIQDLFEEDGQKIKFEILNLKPSKRKKLIYNICKNDKMYVSESQIKTEMNEIEQFLRLQPSFIKFNPDLIMKLTSKYIESDDKSKINVFHDVFRASIVDNIKKGFPSDVQLGSVLLSKIAFQVYINKEYPFCRNVIDEVVTKYNEEYGGGVEDIDEIYDNLKKTGIIKKTNNNKLIFELNNHLSYFIAKEIQRQKNDDNDYAVYDELVRNISTGINGDIILYLSLLENNIRESLKIVEASKNNLINVNQIQLCDLYSNKSSSVTVISNQETENIRYEQNEQRTEKYEEEEFNDIEKVNFFDSDSLTPEQKTISNAFSYLELNCKLFSNFYRNLKLNYKNELVELLYIQSNQILNLLIAPFVKQYDEIRDLVIQKMISDMSKKSLISEDEIRKKCENLFEKMFIFIEYNTIIDVYNVTSILSTCKQNIDWLIKYNKFEANDLTILLNLLFIQRKNKEMFYDKIKDFYKKSTSIVIKDLIKAIFNRYLISNNINISKEEYSVISTLQLSKKDVQIQQYKERMLNEKCNMD